MGRKSHQQQVNEVNQKALEVCLDENLKASGFRKKGPTWYRMNKDVLLIVDLQKSQYGGQYYMNLAFVPPGLDVEGMPTPKEHKCPIRIRATTAFPRNKNAINSMLDLEQDAREETRRIALSDILVSSVLPLMERVSALIGLVTELKEGVLQDAMVTIDAQRLLGIKIE